MPRSVHRTIQSHFVYSALIYVFASSPIFAQDSNTLDCSNDVLVGDVTYNFKPLSSEKTLKRTRATPPSVMVDELRFNVCQDLARKDGIADADQCPTGTRGCLTKMNQKPGSEDRIISVIPVAQTSILQPAYLALQSSKGLSITMHGGPYPSGLNESLAVTQSLNLTLLCTQDGDSEPTFLSYESGVASVQWNTGAGCPVKRDDNGGDGDGTTGGGKEGSSRGSSGIGWFFLLLCIAFVGYFALGAYYNYNNFGATGWDLVPNRDFWRDVPYLMREFTEQLCSTLRPGRTGASRRGYMAV